MRLKRILLFVVLASLLTVVFLRAAVIKNCREYKEQISKELSCVTHTRAVGVEQGVEPKEAISRTQQEKSDSSGADEPLPNLRLLGTVLTEPALAYIEEIPSCRSRGYRIGDAIKGTKLIEIRSGEVVLQRGDKRQTLVLAKKSPITKLSKDEILVNKNEVMEEIAWDLDNLSDLAKISLCYDKTMGKFTGLKVDNIPKNSIVQYAGLHNGDIIKVINGQNLNSPQKAIQVMSKARRLPKIDIELLRGRRSVNLSYTIR